MAERDAEITDYDICDVCGRTMLRGERTELYLDKERAQKHVCVLCRPRVEHQGWISSSAAGSLDRARPASERPRRGRLFGRRGTGEKATDLEEAPHGDPLAEEFEAAVPPEEAPPAPVEEERTDVAPAAIEAGAEPDSGDPPSTPAKRGPLARIQRPARKQPGAIHAVPSNPEGRFRAAVEAFNQSDYSRTVTSISRSLGRPAVSVGALAGSSTDVRITVAWDLSWYQWAVDLADPSDPVTRLGQGNEMSELDAPAKEWNAHADEAGVLSYGEPAAADS